MIQIIEPKSEQEISAYYNLRWELLRKPWGHGRGSEKDESDSNEGVAHALLLVDDEPAGVGRLHFPQPKIAQVRFMAVDDKYQKSGYGSKVLQYLEGIAKTNNVEKIILHSREGAIPFYRKNGYAIVERSYLMWDEIQHYLMEKTLN